MLQITINQRALEVEEGATVLDACRAAAVDVPTMCYLDGHTHFTSCMLCVVKDVGLGRLIPACSARAADGMIIETDTDEVTDARRVALELMLSEHVGDCEGPCERVCPAQIHVPAVLHRLAAGDRAGAGAAYRESQTQPGVPCLACKGRCEKACRRGRIDEAVSIRLLMLYATQGLPEGEEHAPRPRPFNSVIPKLSDEEKADALATADPSPRLHPADEKEGFTAEEARREASRCLHCECRKPTNCRLREYAERYQAKQARYKPMERKPIQVIHQHPSVVYEPGKCIKCGICVKITEASTETFGMAFLSRGYDVTVGVPFSETLDKGLTHTAEACAHHCPTGALSLT